MTVVVYRDFLPAIDIITTATAITRNRFRYAIDIALKFNT